MLNHERTSDVYRRQFRFSRSLTHPKCSLFVRNMWTMRKTVIGSVVGENDWVITWNGRSVGRISLDAFPYNGSKPWTWATWVHPAEHGRVDTMEEAREKVRKVVLRVLANEE
ncbi:hypothetical protein PHIN109289_05435 [Phaeobacter inhibens]